MELQQLKYFQAVAKTGKINEAAETLFVSAPALSTSISRLEKELGVTLFDRTSNRIILNEQGEILLKHIDQIFTTLESAKQELRQSTFHQSPHIPLLSLNSMMWVNLIASFTADFPQYTLSHAISSSVRFAETGFPLQHTFLLAYEDEIPASYKEKLDSLYLFRTKPMVMVHKDHPLAQKEVLDLRELVNERLFLPTAGSSLYARLQQLFQLYDIPFPADKSYSHPVRQRMILESNCVTFFTLYPDHIPLPDIRYIPLSDPFPPRCARLYWRKEHPLTEPETAFRDFTASFYRQEH